MTLKLDDTTRSDFDLLVNTDPTVSYIRRLVNQGMSHEDALMGLVVTLCKQRDASIEECKKLSAIAPRLVSYQGRTLRFDVPDDMIPIQEISNEGVNI